MRGALEFRVLQSAMEKSPPACLGQDRYTDDNPSPGDRIEMRETCNLCPLMAQCLTYRRVGRPEGGTWAGELMTRSN